jgi:hypothetical protein
MLDYDNKIIEGIYNLKKRNITPYAILVDYDTFKEIGQDKTFIFREQLKDAYKEPANKYMELYLIVIENNNIDYIKVVGE